MTTERSMFLRSCVPAAAAVSQNSRRLFHSGVAQTVERGTHNLQAASAILAPATKIIISVDS